MYTSAKRTSKAQTAEQSNRQASKYMAGAMDFHWFRGGGAGNNSTGAKTNNEIMPSACLQDRKGSAAEHKWRPGTARATQIDERKIFSPAQATP